MAAAVTNLLHLPFSKAPTFPSLRSSSPSQFHLPANPSRRPFFLSSSSLRPSFPTAAAAAACVPIDPAVAAVANPALAHANVLFFRSGYNVQIVVEETESEEVLLRRFRREVSKAGVIQECKRRRFFENKQEEKKRKAREAGKRNRRRRFGPRWSSPASASGDNDSNSKKAKDDTDDNWDLPAGDLPY